MKPLKSLFEEIDESPTFQSLITDLEDVENSAPIDGGGIYNHGNLTLTNCTFSRNSAVKGGGMFNLEGSETLTNCTFSGNRANSGGGMYNTSGNSILTNCTFAQNGNALLYYSWGAPGNVELINCILRDGGNEILKTPDSTVMATYSNIDADPLFAALGYYDDNGTPDDISDDNWVAGDYHLKSQAGRYDPSAQAWVVDGVTSPCIDAGNPLSPVMYEPHPRGCFVNMGAYRGTEEASKSPFGCSYEVDGK